MIDTDPMLWDNAFPEEVRQQVFGHFFNADGSEIETASQYHTETMWRHVNMVFFAFQKSKHLTRLFSPDEQTVFCWATLLHDIAKPQCIVAKQRKICTECHRPNVPSLEEKRVISCRSCKSSRLTTISDDFQVCDDCGECNVRILKRKEIVNCYFCKAVLPNEVVTQHGWHGHDTVGASPEVLDPILELIGLPSNEAIRKMVRFHSLVHARIHMEKNSNRAKAEAKKKQSMHHGGFNEELGFDPFALPFAEALTRVFGDPKIAMAAVLLSAADDKGKESPIVEDGFSEEFVDGLIAQLMEGGT